MEKVVEEEEETGRAARVCEVCGPTFFIAYKQHARQPTKDSDGEVSCERSPIALPSTKATKDSECAFSKTRVVKYEWSQL